MVGQHGGSDLHQHHSLLIVMEAKRLQLSSLEAEVLGQIRFFNDEKVNACFAFLLTM